MRLILGSISVSSWLPTYPSPNSTTVNWQQVNVNVGLGRGRWTVAQILILIPILSITVYPTLYLITVCRRFSNAISYKIINLISSVASFLFTYFLFSNNSRLHLNLTVVLQEQWGKEHSYSTSFFTTSFCCNFNFTQLFMIQILLASRKSFLLCIIKCCMYLDFPVKIF